MRYLDLLHACWGMFYAVVIRGPRRTRRILAELDDLLAKHDQSLSTDHRKRIRNYIIGISVTSEWFNQLHGRKLTREEENYALWLGAFTPLADDTMDSTGRSFESVVEDTSGSTAESICIRYLYENLQVLIAKSPTFAREFKVAHEAQNESLKQLEDAELSVDEIRAISFKKGGHYTTLYRSIILEEPVAGEFEAIHPLGCHMQLLNDTVDLYKDSHEGVKTLMTSTCDIYFMEREFETLEEEFFRRLQVVDYPVKRRNRFYLSAQLIMTRSRIAVDFYKDVQGQKDRIDVGEFDRKSLIVDMELPLNLLKNFILVARKTQNLR
ncbi:class 1 isoprenoid biosynthesis enzyme [Phaeocystidibacter luteus]|uniref:Class 1 isoprenoid biosynthesis enzyme n=1 Tax=Phaeocystidibacter luteus TaxID=911197 RepID=A0A6N6RGS7_9FLAO|nr:class 1 isoprenoid biosynthesis enzyme [Phaeocystidibacter luteus]KAB2808039.1 class 1 isoprenoid biosynthesis enzyme [Phaeocystidibacter luteus]